MSLYKFPDDWDEMTPDEQIAWKILHKTEMDSAVAKQMGISLAEYQEFEHFKLIDVPGFRAELVKRFAPPQIAAITVLLNGFKTTEQRAVCNRKFIQNIRLLSPVFYHGTGELTRKEKQ